VAYIALQNLVVIGIIVLKIYDFQYFAQLGLKMTIHAPFGGVLRVKMEKTEFLQFYASRNATTFD